MTQLNLSGKRLGPLSTRLCGGPLTQRTERGVGTGHAICAATGEPPSRRSILSSVDYAVRHPIPPAPRTTGGPAWHSPARLSPGFDRAFLAPGQYRLLATPGGAVRERTAAQSTLAVIPARNEAATVGDVVRRVLATGACDV